MREDILGCVGIFSIEIFGITHVHKKFEKLKTGLWELFL